MATPERPDRLYRLLGVTDQSLPAEEIFRVYRSTEGRLRQQYLSAYRILSNPESKRIYDVFGERVVEFLDSPTWAPVVASLGSTGIAWTYALGLLLTVLMSTIFFIFLALRVDGTVAFNWVSVFSPLYVLNILGLIFTAVCIVIALMHPTLHGIVGTVINFMYLAMLFVCMNLSATQLDSPRGNRWVLIFITLMIGDLLRNAEWCWWRYPSKVRKALAPPVAVADSPNSPPPMGVRLSLLSGSFLTITIVDTLAALFGWITVGLKLDGVLSWSWYILAISFTVRFALQVLWVFLYFEFARHVGQETGCVELLVVFRQCFFAAMAIITLYLVAYFLEGGSDRYTLAFAFIPIYIAWIWLFFCALVTGVYWVMRNHQMIDLECEEIRRYAKLPQWSARSYHEPLDSFGQSPRKIGDGLTSPHMASGVPFGSSATHRDMIDGVTLSMQQHRVAHVFNLSDSEVSDDTELEPVVIDEVYVREAAPSESQLSDLSVYRRGYPEGYAQ